MKCDVMTCLGQIEKKELQKLCCEVRETLAAGIVLPGAKEQNASFSVAELWSLRKSMKTAGRSWNNRARAFVVRG